MKRNINKISYKDSVKVTATFNGRVINSRQDAGFNSAKEAINYFISSSLNGRDCAGYIFEVYNLDRETWSEYKMTINGNLRKI